MSDQKAPDPSVSEGVEPAVQAGEAVVTPPEEAKPEQKLSDLPDHVAEDIRTAAGGGS